MNSNCARYIKNYSRIFFFSTFVFICVFSGWCQSVTFNYNGASQTYTVPPCVTSLTFTVAGADGGGPSGGNGAIVTATISVTPGQVITLIPGGSGNGITGGFNGGGGGRNANSTANASFGGGGASTVTINGTPVIIAAGGGGSGGGTEDAAGGNGGCATGVIGISPFGQGGGGATQFAGGTGGPPWISSGYAGSPGASGQGGLGAIDPCYNNSPGGGGGGGYFGGGGGGSDCFDLAPFGGGGGGGGSSLIPAGAGCNPGMNNGPGYITISGAVVPATPTFAAIPPICAGGVFPILPTTSLNMITGTWSPAPNNTTTTSYTFTPSGPCPGATATITITVNPNTSPTFTQVAPICSGAALNPLPTTSINGITGTWAPALNNSATTTYTFTPTAGMCATPTTMTIIVNPNVTPTFNPVAAICTGAVLSPLPTTSSNGIAGTWSPALNNTVTTTYTFTPTAGQCALTNNITITVNPTILPTFNAINPICEGATLSPLPVTSTNGITGTWSPALNNIATTTYTFMPNAGSCASNTTLTITVNPNVIPTFTQVSAACSGSVIPPLPLTSTNGLSGTWTPVLNNTATTIYTFSPSSGVCSLTQTMTITINPNITPTFSAVAPICSGATLNPLPTISTNGVSGSWSPALNNSATTIYTFTPNSLAGMCTSNANLTITVNQNVSPTFDPIAAICSGGSLSPLLTTSTNGFTGTWSPALDNTMTTTYMFTPTAGLCALTASSTITVNPNIAPVFAQIAPICSGDVLAPLPTTSINGINGTWSPSMNNTTTTTYTFIPSAGICATSGSMTITVFSNISPTFTPIDAICSGEILAAFPTTSMNGFVGSWTPAPNNLTTTIYTFTPVPVSGTCLSSATLSVVVNPIISPDFAQIPPICSGSSLDAFPTISPNGISGTWSPLPNSLVTTSYDFTPAIGQCAVSAMMTVSVNPLPAPSFTFIQEAGCTPIRVTFTNTSPGLNTYNWQFGNGNNSTATDPEIVFNGDGCNDVSLTATSNLGCSSTITELNLICITPAPEALFSSSLSELSEDNLTNSFFNESENANMFIWNFGDGSDSLIAYEGSYTYPNLNGAEYTVTLIAMNDLGCSDTYSITYGFEEELLYFIPNTFTPDGDEFNHWFLPIFTSGFNPNSFNFKIYNRWGEIIFESMDASVGWNGTYDGKEALSGTYNWTVEFEGKNSFERKTIKGKVNLLK